MQPQQVPSASGIDETVVIALIEMVDDAKPAALEIDSTCGNCTVTSTVTEPSSSTTDHDKPKSGGLQNQSPNIGVNARALENPNPKTRLTGVSNTVTETALNSEMFPTVPLAKPHAGRKKKVATAGKVATVGRKEMATTSRKKAAPFQKSDDEIRALIPGQCQPQIGQIGLTKWGGKLCPLLILSPVDVPDNVRWNWFDANSKVGRSDCAA
jgi:hypothetical protein